MLAPKFYMPSNGTVGDAFESKWCAHCTRDDFDADLLCPILARGLSGEQPPEWIYINNTPTCTAFTDKPLPAPRCPLTKEMF